MSSLLRRRLKITHLMQSLGSCQIFVQKRIIDQGHIKEDIDLRETCAISAFCMSRPPRRG